MNTPYLKPPIDLAQNAIVEGYYRQAGTYLAFPFIYSGKACLSDKPQNKLAELTGVRPRTVYRHFQWLLDRNWMGKDERNGWLFCRGLDYVKDLEDWPHARAAVLLIEDLQHIKEFFIGAVLASIVRSGKGAGTDQPCKRSEQSGFPISLNTVKKAFDVSRRTAITYRKIAKKRGFIKMAPNLRQVTGIATSDIQELRQNNVNQRIKVNLFGSSESISVKTQQLRKDKGYVYVQLANIITPEVLLKKR